MKLLLVEDEPKLAAFMKEAIETLHYDVDVAHDGLLGQKLGIKNNYELIILDIILPYLSGIELCRNIRKHKPNVPILMLTALGTTEDKLNGFDAGADDYLVKPFEVKELLARIRALTRRGQVIQTVGEELAVSNLRLNLSKKVAFRNDVRIELTAKEFSLLEFLMRNKGIVKSRAEIAERVWDIDFDTGTNIVDVYMNFLRKKIDRNFTPKLIHTLIGLGYTLEER
jgi:two-component system, OmpR family, copper resistance phosphate regulon response regulator CusR